MPFATVIGHTPVVDLLRQAVGRQRVPQSLLLAGPDGVGKRTLAIALAQAVNCPVRARAAKGGTAAGAAATDACGTCSTCLRIARGVHSDVTLLDRGDEASIKIRTLRERVLETIGYRPFEAARRVYIIDGADDMGREAQDALLKTLEEPPPAAMILLVTAFPDTLSSTIQSRCRRLRFGPLSEDEVARVLVERLRVDPAKARALAAVAGGSVARANADQAEEIGEDRDAALALLRAAASGRSVAPRLKAATALAQHGSKRRDREALGSRLAAAASLLRDLGVMASRGSIALANADLRSELQMLAPAYGLDRVSTGYGVIVRAQAALDRNASPKIVADWVAVGI